MKLTDLIKPEHVVAAYHKYESLSAADMETALDSHIKELFPIAGVISLAAHGTEFATTMTAISIIDLAIQEATAETPKTDGTLP